MSTEKKKDIFKTIKKLINDIEEPANFAVKVSRKGEHRFTSTDLARDLAAAAFERWPNIKVNLNEPSLEINVQIINNSFRQAISSDLAKNKYTIKNFQLYNINNSASDIKHT